MILKTKFYQRDPKEVAKDLLGKILVRKLDGKKLAGIIVETEAYYGTDDPASRAFHGIKEYNKAMWGAPGTLFIYNVHKHWMLNFVAHEQGGVGAVLIRAIQPIQGIDVMKANRKACDEISLTNGPGKLTQALKIDKSLNLIDATSEKSPIYVLFTKNKPSIATSHRIGVKKDLKQKLRFYIKDNPFVSR